MKTRLLFVLLAAGSIVLLLLVRTQRSLPPFIENPSQSDAVLETDALLVSNQVSTQLSPPDSEKAQSNSKTEILDLIKRIQAALKTGALADHDLVYTNLLLELIKSDPASAASLAESMEPGPMREEMLSRVAQHWAEQDLASAKLWAEQLSDEGERKSVLTDICFQIAQNDPQQALQMADKNGLGSLPGATLQNLVQQWAAKDLTSALAWANERPVGEEKDQMLARIAMVLAETSPSKAAQMVVEQIPAGNSQTEAAISVLYQWAKSDMAGARAWVELFPESPLRERALNELKGAEQYQHTASQLKP